MPTYHAVQTHYWVWLQNEFFSTFYFLFWIIKRLVLIDSNLCLFGQALGLQIIFILFLHLLNLNHCLLDLLRIFFFLCNFPGALSRRLRLRLALLGCLIKFHFAVGVVKSDFFLFFYFRFFLFYRRFYGFEADF